MPETFASSKVTRAQRVIKIGAILTVLGILASLIAILPLVSDIELSGAWWFLSMITGIGLATIIAGLTMSARSRSARSRSARSRSARSRSARSRSTHSKSGSRG